MLSPDYKPILFDSPLTLSEIITLEVQLLRAPDKEVRGT